MKLQYHEPEYYHALYNRICDLPFVEVPLNHKSEEDKLKFENHVKSWVDDDEFRVFNFYLLFSDDYDKLLKFEYPHNRMTDYNDDGTLKNLDKPITLK